MDLPLRDELDRQVRSSQLWRHAIRTTPSDHLLLGNVPNIARCERSAPCCLCFQSIWLQLDLFVPVERLLCRRIFHISGYPTAPCSTTPTQSAGTINQILQWI